MRLIVASGKGGTGKTLVAVNLAAVTEQVQVLDSDVEGANVHLFLQPRQTTMAPATVPRVVIDAERCDGCGKCAEACAFNALALLNNRIMIFAEFCHGCGLCTYLCPRGAISEAPAEVGVVYRGSGKTGDLVWGELATGQAMASAVIRAVQARARDDRGPVIVDAPPGAGCSLAAAMHGADVCLLVTEGTLAGRHDLALAADVARAFGVPAGVVLNRAGLGDAALIRDWCAAHGLPLLAEIPFSREIAATVAAGGLLAVRPEWRDLFVRLRDDAAALAAVPA